MSSEDGENMKAFRVWSTWVNDPDSDAMHPAAFERAERAQVIADASNAVHQEKVGPGSTCRYVVREEEIPREIVCDNKPDRAVMVFLGDDTIATDVSKR
jgi:hypothetical protein